MIDFIKFIIYLLISACFYVPGGFIIILGSIVIEAGKDLQGFLRIETKKQ